ncbi:hypothetical protein GCM10027093_45230 [Paraburkholderia jirisanensis]
MRRACPASKQCEGNTGNGTDIGKGLRERSIGLKQNGGCKRGMCDTAVQNRQAGGRRDPAL